MSATRATQLLAAARTDLVRPPEDRRWFQDPVYVLVLLFLVCAIGFPIVRFSPFW